MKNKYFSHTLLITVSIFYSSHAFSLSDRAATCLALAWGADACGLAVDQYAEKHLNSDANDIIASPACAAMVSHSLGQGFSSDDLSIALITGALDQGGESGTESDSLFNNILGVISYATSHTIKANVYNKCMRRYGL